MELCKNNYILLFVHNTYTIIIYVRILGCGYEYAEFTCIHMFTY